ncbi:hypothetical protein F5Y16DRAFT_402178 [Xylariaceae sp. FL0255]|nr:hypothetical protein F5Y16DRAFT_402178 [Xylariaceae sp. FL0255]
MAVLATCTAIATLSNITARFACGPVDGDCDKNLCAGLNDPNGGKVCGGISTCFANLCRGIRDLDSPMGGICTYGSYAGCWCDMGIGDTEDCSFYKDGPCDENDCSGVPDDNINPITGWKCSNGRYSGCACKPAA